jgi:hypothetical protein
MPAMRPADDRGLHHALGFAADAVPMSEGTPFANVLLVAREPARASLPNS